MKKLLLFVMAVMAFAGMSVAQDVYVAGISSDEGGNLTAALFRNGSLLYEHSTDVYHVSYSVVANPNNGDVFWTDSYEVSGGMSSSVYKNDDAFLNVNQAFFAKLCWYPWGSGNPEDDLFTVGYRSGTSGGNYVTVWQGADATPLYSPGYDSGITSAAADIIAVQSPTGMPDIYYCGNREAEGQNYDIATVWKNDEVLYTLSEMNSVAMSMDYYNGHLYTLVLDDYSDYGVLNLFEDDHLLSTILDNTNNYMRTEVKIVGGDTYIYVFSEMGTTKVWKNGELLYTYEDLPLMEIDAAGFDVTSDGVYYVSLEYDVEQMQGNFLVLKDEDIISMYDIYELTQLSDICVVMGCADNEAREVPYFEGFEMGATDWECWTVTDEGANCNEEGQYYNSYWHRAGADEGVSPITGDHCAMYQWNDGQVQEGWLISPLIHIPYGVMTLLSFNTYERYYYDMQYEGVWISTTNSNPGSFAEIWVQENPSDEWKEVDIDLTDYQAQDVYFAFKYSGLNGHSWYVDDVNVVYMPLPPSSVDEAIENSLAVYPNPANESIRIDGLENAYEVQIYNSLGALVKVITVAPDQEIGISDLANGLYSLRCGNKAVRFVKN